MVPSINYTGFSFVGRRAKNQDSVLFKKINKDTFLFAVADGMGGYKGGEIASEIAVSTLLKTVKNKIETQDDLKLILKEAYLASDEKIALESKNNPDLESMGTTMVSVLIHKNKYAWANIGDSRLYFLKDNILTQISEDHSYINEFEKKNGIPASVDIVDKYGHFLTKCLDGNKSLPDLYPLDKDYNKLEDNTCFMLCSDGLINDRVNTNLTLFQNYLLGDKSLENSAKNLIGQAYAHGSNDNISIIIVDVGLKMDKKLKLKQFDYPPSENNEGKSKSFFSNFFKW